eukprot:362866-Chlamydomonas_euryale.AAC.3
MPPFRTLPFDTAPRWYTPDADHAGPIFLKRGIAVHCFSPLYAPPPVTYPPALHSTDRLSPTNLHSASRIACRTIIPTPLYGPLVSHPPALVEVGVGLHLSVEDLGNLDCLVHIEEVVVWRNRWLHVDRNLAHSSVELAGRTPDLLGAGRLRELTWQTAGDALGGERPLRYSHQLECSASDQNIAHGLDGQCCGIVERAAEQAVRMMAVCQVTVKQAVLNECCVSDAKAPKTWHGSQRTYPE